MSLKVLFVKYHDTNIRPIPDQAERDLQILPSLGILYMAAMLREDGFEVEILDANAENLKPDAFKQRVAASGARIVGITSMTAGWPSTVEGGKLIKEALPDCILVVGGPHLSIYPELCLQGFPQFDVAVIGSGEETMLELVRAIDRGQNWKSIHSTVVRVDGKIKKNSERTWYRQIDAYPFPAVDLLKRDLYRAITVESPFFTMITSRGCPFKCRFCSQVYGNNIARLRSPESVVDEIEIYVNKYGAKEIVFFDETFTVKKQRVFDICRLIGERKLKVSFDIRTRVDSVNEEMIAAIREAGGRRIHLGIESGTQKIIDRMGKGITLEQVRNAVGWAKKYGFETRGYFMIGYLGEDPSTYKETIRVARSLELDWASFSITTPLPATALFREAVELGYISEDYWKKYTLLDVPRYDFPVIETEYWDEKKLHKMLRNAFFKFYVRPRIIWNRLKRVRTKEDIAELFRGLGILRSMK